MDPSGETSDARVSGWRASTPLFALISPGKVHGNLRRVGLLVALAQIGDRTQLLAVMLASRYRKPVPILPGIFVATLAGFYLSSLLQLIWFEYVIALSFVAMAVWALVPDKAKDDSRFGTRHWGTFLTTVRSFFLVEIGNKTQIATAALAARYHDIVVVAAGTTTGMMITNIPAVFLGQAVTRVLPIRELQIAAALLYLGLWGFATTAGWARQVK